VSKRHQSNRRKTYGRRQHELHERRQRDPQPDSIEMVLDDLGQGSIADRYADLDAGTAGLRYAIGD
jgi:hypothetical protein